ncbi:MAG: hypothetical protein HOV81_08240 [Kofleriaceae bacterium]|nr:hypothetical protein [Kofleriaceae bacterium]
MIDVRRLLVCCLAGCSFDHGALAPDGAPDSLPDAAPTMATLFVADYQAGQLHRIQLARGAEPAITLSLALPGALSPVYLPATGELLVGELANARIDRFATPLATPMFDDAITGVGLDANISKMAVVDGELWVTNPLGANVDRLAFDAAGTPSMVDAVGVVNGRGLVYVPATRDVFVTQCCSTNVIQHYVFDNHVVATKEPVSDNGLNNPHGLVMLPWFELLVANAGDSSILRFRIDGAGNATPNGVITGNGLSVPIDLALTPWGELYVTNLGTGTLSRFTFDESHTAVAGGTFAIPGAIALAWTALVESE